HRFLGLTVGHGYQPWRAALGLLLTIAISVGLAVGAGAAGLTAEKTNTASAVAQAPTSPAPKSKRCSVLEGVGLGIDMSAPLLKTGARDRCDFILARRPNPLVV